MQNYNFYFKHQRLVSKQSYEISTTLIIMMCFLDYYDVPSCFLKRNVFIKPDEQDRACSGYAMARKCALKWNVFVKPDEQRRACSGYAMVRKCALKRNVFIKPNEQRRACSGYAMARKGALKWNIKNGLRVYHSKPVFLR